MTKNKKLKKGLFVFSSYNYISPYFIKYDLNPALCKANINTINNRVDTKGINIFKKDIEILRINFLDSIDIKISKQDIINSNLYEDFALYQAHALALIPENIQANFTTSNIYGEYIDFILYWCENKKLLELSKMKKNYFLDPFKVFSNIYRLDSTLKHFTLLIIDSNKQALCNYQFGQPTFIYIKNKDIFIENFLSEMEFIGEMLCFNFTNESINNPNFYNLDEYFGVDRESLLKTLSMMQLNGSNKIGRQEKIIYNKDFIATKNIILISITVVIFICVYFLLSLANNKIQEHKDKKAYKDNISYEVAKKQSYTTMYQKVFDEIQNKKTRFIYIKQNYINNKWINIP